MPKLGCVVQQSDRRQASRQRLLDAAAQLITRRGASVSLEAIGAQAGMSRGAVNYFFDSKGALLLALASEQDPDWPDVALQPGDDFGRWLDRWATPLLAGRHKLRLTTMLTYEGLSGNSPVLLALAARRRSMSSEVGAALGALHDRGWLEAPATSALADLVVSSILGLLPDAWDSPETSRSVGDGYTELRVVLAAAAGATEAPDPGGADTARPGFRDD